MWVELRKSMITLLVCRMTPNLKRKSALLYIFKESSMPDLKVAVYTHVQKSLVQV